MSYLRRFPSDTLKIDRSFISDMNNNESLEVVKTIVTLAHKIGLVVVAEGVETPEQAVQLKALACESAQGYFFSKPLNPEAVGQELFAIVAGTAPLCTQLNLDRLSEVVEGYCGPPDSGLELEMLP